MGELLDELITQFMGEFMGELIPQCFTQLLGGLLGEFYPLRSANEAVLRTEWSCEPQAILRFLRLRTG